MKHFSRLLMNAFDCYTFNVLFQLIFAETNIYIICENIENRVKYTRVIDIMTASF